MQNTKLGAMCFLTDALLWEKYGHWDLRIKDGQAIALRPSVIAEAKQAAAMLNPANIQYEITDGHFVGSNYECRYRIYDAANPFIEAWEVGLQTKSERRAQEYVAQRAAEMKRLHNGSVDALIHYAKTGNPVQPAWVPDSQLDQYDAKGIKHRVYPRYEQAN